jgi:para-nitrobenzyl esterase
MDAPRARTATGPVRGSWAPWDGVRDVSAFGPPPPQPVRPPAGDDWLTLAVWTPDPGGSGLPVVAWISGGTYLRCATANPRLNGATLAAGGAVVVSAHYRTGAEGFAHLHGAPDNRGLLDQAAALRWIQDKVAEFGGDPGNVTVFGQSAGAGSVAALLVMPSAAGLFRRAIMQSLPGTYFNTGFAADIAEDIAAQLGRSPRADQLAGVAPRDLVLAARTVTERLPRCTDRWGPIALTPTPFSPVVDGDVLPDAPWRPSRRERPAASTCSWGTRDEFSLLAAQLGDITDDQVDTVPDNLAPTVGAAGYRAAFPPCFGRGVARDGGR